VKVVKNSEGKSTMFTVFFVLMGNPPLLLTEFMFGLTTV